MELRLSKRPGRLLRPPAIIKRAIGHWITIRKKRRRIVIDYWHADFVELHRNFAEPLVTNDITGRSFVRAIDVGAAPQSFFFSRDRIDNHSTNGFSIRRVQPADQQQNGVIHLADCLEALKIEIPQWAGDLPRK